MPSQSTLLQVLVSVQSMIFCDKPWYNEPGRETRPNEAASRAYSGEIQGYTIRLALLGWLQPQSATASTSAKVPVPEPLPPFESIWTNVVHKHFEANSRDIDKTVAGWVASASAASPLRSLSSQLTAAFKQGGYVY